MEDNLKNDLKNKWKMNQSTKINLIGGDTVVNSPSLVKSEMVSQSANE